MLVRLPNVRGLGVAWFYCHILDMHIHVCVCLCVCMHICLYPCLVCVLANASLYSVLIYASLYTHTHTLSLSLTHTHTQINFVKSDDIRILRDIEQYYSTQIDEMPMNLADLV